MNNIKKIAAKTRYKVSVNGKVVKKDIIHKDVLSVLNIVTKDNKTGVKLIIQL